jgi:ribosomal protein S18 acetylase RimI-like enzyme
MEIRQAKRDEFGTIAGLIAGYNENPATQCIHSGEGTEAILKQMEIWDDGGEIVFVAGWQGGQVVAVFGCEFDVEEGKGWLWGPFAEDGETAVSLYHALLNTLPDSISLIYSYLHEANTKGDAFYRGQGFHTPKVAHVYVAPRPDNIIEPTQLAAELTPHQADGAAQLHDLTFPTTFYSGKEILSQLDETHKMFVQADGDQLLGYIYAKVDDAADEGYVEFLGVREEARRRGVGRVLLATAVYWLFHNHQVPQIALNVNDDNDNARGLYESAGFHLHFTGVALRKEIK